MAKATLPQPGDGAPRARRKLATTVGLPVMVLVLALFPFAALAAGFTPDQSIQLGALLVDGLAHLVELHLAQTIAAVALGLLGTIATIWARRRQ